MEGFYNFLYSLDYLDPQYALKMEGKELFELSPGERGLLLLLFTFSSRKTTDHSLSTNLKRISTMKLFTRFWFPRSSSRNSGGRSLSLRTTPTSRLSPTQTKSSPRVSTSRICAESLMHQVLWKTQP